MKYPIGLKISLLVILFLSFFQNCQGDFSNSIKREQVTSFNSMIDKDLNAVDLRATNSGLCHQWTAGNDSEGKLIKGPLLGNCLPNQTPYLFSVTHENECNHHFACNGYPIDKNYRENVRSYMSDYYPNDIGSWLKYSASGDRKTNSIQLALDTINFANFTTPTGRPVSNGYLFYGLADLSLNNVVNLNDDVWIEFDYRIIQSEQTDPIKSANRLTLGMSLHWNEVNRENKSHFFEINLYKTPGFHAAHFNPNLCPKDSTYDHCFYDPNGKWAEGKYVSSLIGLGIPEHGPDGQWRAVRVNIFKLIKQFQWFHPPHDLSQAFTSGLYIGLEMQGRSHLYVALRNLRFYKQALWGAWKNQGTCSKPCGGGVITQARECLDSLHIDNRVQCFGESTQTIACNTHSCSTSSSTNKPTSSTNVVFNGTSKPVGLFRDGSGGYQSNGISYCVFNSGNELKAAGYSQLDYDHARQIPKAKILLPYKGTCLGGPATGLVRQLQAGIIRSASGYCVINTNQLTQCGFRQSDYDRAPQVSIGSLKTYPFCNCK